jgi:hypothetical protein
MINHDNLSIAEAYKAIYTESHFRDNSPSNWASDMFNKTFQVDGLDFKISPKGRTAPSGNPIAGTGDVLITCLNYGNSVGLSPDLTGIDTFNKTIEFIKRNMKRFTGEEKPTMDVGFGLEQQGRTKRRY